MAIFKKKAKSDREHGARSPTNSPPVQAQPSMVGAAQRGVSDSYAVTNTNAGNPRRMTNSIQFGAPPPSVLKDPPNGRASPAPGPGGLPGQGYNLGMGLPSAIQSPGGQLPQHQQHQQQASMSSLNGPMSPLAMVTAQNMGPQSTQLQMHQQQQQQQQQGGIQQIPPHNPGYPWSTRSLRLYQPAGQANPVSPFPRYGLSVPPYPSHSGHMLLFGGLVRDRAHNDLWSLDVRDCSLQLVKTRGEAPLPRIGHVSAISDRIMLIFGGDTKINEDDKQDDGLYVLDLRTQQWSNIPVVAGPCGRYGHAACMQGGYFYVHGGHVDGKNFDDLWSFDIRQLAQETGPFKWERIQYNSPAPLARTGHTLVPFQNKLFLFGGTDGDYHYNDSWSFDIGTGVWSELECIGYIPIPREGHAAAIVDDVVYVFGGRDVHGKDLGDLAAFRISNQRWYMFQNMGPSPMAKSGHSLCAAHGKVFVIGGESNLSPQVQKDDPNVIHVLDTVKIKYPSDNQSPGAGTRQVQQGRPRTTSDATDRRPTNGMNPNGSSPYGIGLPPGSTQAAYLASRSHDNLSRAMSPPHIASERRPLIVTNDTSSNHSRHAPRSESIDSAGPPSGGRVNGQAQPGRAVAEENVPQPMLQGLSQQGALPQGAPPQRPRREGDEEYRRAMSPPEVTINGTPNTSSSSPTNESVVTPNGEAMTPTRRSASPPPPGHVASHTVHPNLRNTRSPPPQLRAGEDGQRPSLPPDAFYFSGKSPTGGSRPGSMLGRPGSILGRPGSIIGNRPGSVAGTADLLREIKARETEADNAKRREAALRVILSSAIEQGFVVNDDMADVPPPDLLSNDNHQIRGIATALKQLKQEKANLQNEVASHMRLASDKIQEHERMQKSALQEAAYYRAKLVALESGNANEISRMDMERISDLERQLESTTIEHAGGQRELERLKAEAAHHQKLATTSTEAETETLKRAEAAEEEVTRLQEEIEALREQTATHDQSIRDHTERFITLTSTHQQREAERDDYKTQLEDVRGKQEEFVLLLEQAQASIAATGLRATEFETMHGRAKEQISALEQELAETRRALEVKSREAEQAAARLAEVEGMHTSAREEVTNYRSMTSGRLGELLESHRALQDDDTRGVKGHQDQLRALEEEKSSLLKLLRDAGERVDATEAVASSHRKRAREIEQQHATLRGEMRVHRTKLAAAQNELAKYSELFTNKDSELHERDQAVTELQTRVSLMRKLLGEHGITVSDADLESAETSSAGELESKLRDKSRAHDTAQREIDELKRRCYEAEDKVDSLSRMVERYKDARSPSAGSMRSSSPGGEGDASQRARDAERKLAEAEEAHQKRLTALQSDYETAVRYVKGTEKMLKRMKDELNKQKMTNTSLLSDLDQMRGRSGSVEPGTRGLSGRTTPSDGELTRKIHTLQNQYTALQAELQASQDTLNARNREWDLLRARTEENERENEALREDLAQAHHRIETLLEINPSGIHLGSDDEDERLGGLRRGSSTSSDGGASMAFDKFTKELKQWERARSPDAHDVDESALMSDHESGRSHSRSGPNGKASPHTPVTPSYPTAPGMPMSVGVPHERNVSGEWA